MAAAGPSWLGHALAEPMLRFNTLPSLWLHPDYTLRLLPESLRAVLDEDPDAIAGPVLHRHWSATLTRELGLKAVESLEEPALTIALLEIDEFERLKQWCGIALLASPVRRAIARNDVTSLQAQLGEDGMEFARREAALMPGIGHADAMALQADVGAQVGSLGSALLSAAFDAAQEAVATRARLRLAPDARAALGQLPEQLCEGRAALALAESVLQYLDPAWLSLFPTRH